MHLRNCIMIALPFDATKEECDHAHAIVDRIYGESGNAGGVDPTYLVNNEVPATDNGSTATGKQVTTDAANPAPAAPAAAGVELDKSGLPWDERIHSSNKKMTDKGLWRMKRNVSDEVKTKVEAELRQTVGATAPTTPAPAAPAATAPAPAAPAATAPAPAAPPLPGANLPPMPGAPQTDPAYANLVKLIADNTHSAANPTGRITDDWVVQLLTHFGVAEGSLQNLAHAPQLIPQIDAYIRQVLAQ